MSTNMIGQAWSADVLLRANAQAAIADAFVMFAAILCTTADLPWQRVCCCSLTDWWRDCRDCVGGTSGGGMVQEKR